MAAMTATVGFHGNKYGAVELKEVYHKNWSVALLVATIIHFGVIGSYLATGVFDPAIEPNPPRGFVLTNPEYIQLPGIPKLPTSRSAGTSVRPNVGAPIPVPDIEINPDKTIAAQNDMNVPFTPDGKSEGTGEPVQSPIEVVEEGPPPIFVPFEKEPVIIKGVKPAYPELALRAGMEGKVTVRVWVDKEGKPRQVEILTTEAEIFNESALTAARQFLFTPAVMNNGPVSVWVTLPFRFTLAERK